jgi:lysophospholipase L1-like esterase
MHHLTTIVSLADYGDRVLINIRSSVAQFWKHSGNTVRPLSAISYGIPSMNAWPHKRITLTIKTEPLSENTLLTMLNSEGTPASAPERRVHRYVLVILTTAVTGGLVAVVGFLPMPFERWEHANIQEALFNQHALPGVLVIGDSVSIQYRAPLAKRLVRCARVLQPVRLARQTLWARWQNPSLRPINARSSSHLRSNLAFWLGDKQFDLIMVNVGLHDALHSPPGASDALIVSAYQENLQSVLQILVKHSKQVLFISTTPTRAPQVSLAKLELIRQLNDAARALAQSLDITYLDIEAQAPIDAPTYIDADGIHLTDEGASMVADLLAAHIMTSLKLHDSAGCRLSKYHPHT